MKKLLLIPFLFVAIVHAQNSRWDWQATTVTGSGQQIPVLALPFAQISFFVCSGGNCSAPASTYNSASSSSACPTGAQVVLQKSAACTNKADAQGNFGAWFLPSQYAYTVKPVSGGTYGPFNFTIGAGSTGSGVTNVSGVDANGFTVNVANQTTTPAITVGTDGTHLLPVNTGSAANCLTQAGTYPPCATGSVTGSGTLGHVPLWTPSGTALGNSHLDEVISGADTFTQKVVVNDGTGHSGVYQPGIGTDAGGVTGTATYTTDTTNGYAEVHEGTAALSRLCTAANAATNTGCQAASSGVTSYTGDGTLISNSASTGAVTATLATAGAHKYFGNNTGSTAAPAYESIAYADLPALSANTVLGALTATTPSGLALPSCSGGTNALIWTSGTGFGCNTISAGLGTVTTTGSPVSGNLTKFSGATSVTNSDLSGDCTTSGTLAVTCLKTNGTSFTGYATAAYVADITITVGSTVTFAANTCSSYTGTGGTASTTTMTGVGTGMTFMHTPTSDVHAVTGWSPASGGSLYFTSWPTSNTLNDYVCNPTGSAIVTGGSVIWNVSAK
jgi:hypothetical protein